MKIKLIIATSDVGYQEHLSRVLSEKYSDSFDVRVYSSEEHLTEMFSKSEFYAGRLYVVLCEPCLAGLIDRNGPNLPIVLLDETGSLDDGVKDLASVRKYQRISSIVGAVMGEYAKYARGLDLERAQVTAVWSPAGGVGKTTVALAYAFHMASMRKRTVYLNLENFSSTSAYFGEKGASISTIFEKFEKLGSKVSVLLAGIRQRDGDSGIMYFCEPDNYDDINALTPGSIETLIKACAVEADELVVDMSSQCGGQARKIFEMADDVFLVCDSQAASRAKLQQFMTQHNIWLTIKEKSVFIYNKGAGAAADGVKFLCLPAVGSEEHVLVYKTLAKGFEGWRQD